MERLFMEGGTEISEHGVWYYKVFCYPITPDTQTRVVLIQKPDNSYTGRIGNGDCKGVVYNGEKLVFEEAVKYFPWITREKYKE